MHITIMLQIITNHKSFDFYLYLHIVFSPGRDNLSPMIYNQRIKRNGSVIIIKILNYYLYIDIYIYIYIYIYVYLI